MKKKDVAKKMTKAQKHWYSPANQRGMHYQSIRKIVKPEFWGEEYKKVKDGFPIPKEKPKKPHKDSGYGSGFPAKERKK